MQSPVLFPLHEDLVPDTTRTEPLVWIQRLVLLREPSVDAVIRDVTFECGLNIIRTEERTDVEELVVAHSVGKTLLMRLIRYTAGEPNYASEEAQNELEKVLPAAIVVAHWRVNGEDWIIRRPLHKHDPSDSVAIESKDWQHTFDDSAKTLAFKSFLRRLDSAIRGDLPPFEIGSDRTAKWSDVLGWLARDCECGYRQANEWRHADTNLGPLGDLNVNKLTMQWLCGLMSADEAVLRNEHRGLLAEHRKAKAAADRQSKATSFSEQSLRDSMGRPPATESPANDALGFLAGETEASFLEYAKGMLDHSQALLDEVRESSPIETLNTKVAQIQAKLDQAKAAETEASVSLQWAKKYERDLKSAATDPPLLTKCPADPCKLREKLKQDREFGRDESIAQKLADTHRTIEDQTEAASTAADARKSLQQEFDAAKEELERCRRHQSESETKLIEQIGRWKQHVADAERFDKVAQETGGLDQTVADLAKSIDVSHEKQEAARSAMDHKQRISDASAAYTQILQRVFNDDATGTIQVDGNGLQPRPAKKLTPGGRALSAMATVVSFDLACVMASIAGVGNHPRFLIHDSPREGEMEMPLFKRIFDVACYLESVFGKQPPSFQYIVTTTKAPPSYCAENEPHTRLILHGREGDGRLLKLTF